MMSNTKTLEEFSGFAFQARAKEHFLANSDHHQNKEAAMKRRVVFVLTKAGTHSRIGSRIHVAFDEATGIQGGKQHGMQHATVAEHDAWNGIRAAGGLEALKKFACFGCATRRFSCLKLIFWRSPNGAKLIPKERSRAATCNSMQLFRNTRAVNVVSDKARAACSGRSAPYF